MFSRSLLVCVFVQLEAMCCYFLRQHGLSDAFECKPVACVRCVMVWVNRSCWSFLRRLDPFVPFRCSLFAATFAFYSFFREYTSVTVWLQQSISVQKRKKSKEKWRGKAVALVRRLLCLLSSCCFVRLFGSWLFLWNILTHYNVLVSMLRPIWFLATMTFHLEMKIVRSVVRVWNVSVARGVVQTVFISCANGFYGVCVIMPTDQKPIGWSNTFAVNRCTFNGWS